MWHPPPKRGTPSLHRGMLREGVAAAGTPWQLHRYVPCTAFYLQSLPQSISLLMLYRVTL